MWLIVLRAYLYRSVHQEITLSDVKCHLVLKQMQGRDHVGEPFARISDSAVTPDEPPPLPPVVRVEPEIFVDLNATLQLSCDVASTIPYSVYWYKEGHNGTIAKYTEY